MQGARLVNKGGKIGIKRNNQTFDQECEKIVSERKGIRTSCVWRPRLFSYSKVTLRLGRKKRGHFVLLLRINF